MPKLPVLDPATLEPVTGTFYPAPFETATDGRSKRQLTELLGLTQFGVNITELAPQSASSLRHWHSHEDEFVYVLEGEVTLLSDAGEQTLGPGMCMGFPAGKPDGHCIHNKTDRPATILEVGSRNMADEGNYSDVDLHCKAGRYEKAVFTKKDGTPVG